MTVIRSLTFCGTLFSLLVILVALSSQLDFVLGQDESAVSETADSDGAPGPTLVLSTSVGSHQEENEVIDQGTEADEHCPCVEEKSCPRKYGSDPLDFTTFGHLESCSEAGYVRCCGVSVSVVQQTDETVGGGVTTASDIDEYDETATWDLGHAAEQQQEHISEDISNKDNSEVSSDNLHEIHQGQVNQDTEKEEGEEEQSSASGDEESKKENDEQSQEEQIIDDNEEEDNVAAESTQNVQTVLMDEPVSPPRKRFQPASYKFPRYGGRPAAAAAAPENVQENAQENVVPYDSSSSAVPSPPMSSGGNEDSSSSNVSPGNNFRRKTFPSLRGQKVNPTPTSTPDNNDSGGSVVYSQRVSDFTPYRSRNNVNRNNNNHNKASIVTATTVDGGSDITEETVETTPTSAEASSSLANVETPARQRYPQRKRRPFNQMRNRQQQQDSEQPELTDSKSLVMDGEEIGAQIKPEQPIYGTSGSGQSSPAPLHVPAEQEESPVVGEALSAVVDDQLDNNRRRPMSRLVKPRVNGPNNHGRRRMKPAMSDENGDNSLYPNNSYGSAPTTHPTDNGNEQQQKQELLSSSQEEESSGSIPDDSSAESQATIGSAAVEESGKNGGAVIQNSPTGKLMPLRPKIRPLQFNRKAPGWSATSNDNAEGGDSQVNDDESKEVDLSGNTSSSGDLIKHTEQQQPNNGPVNIRRIPMRRVQQQQQQQPENVPEENEGGGGVDDDGGNVEPEVPVPTVPVVKGRISMKRPINYPGKNNNNVPPTAPVQQLSTSIETEAEPNVQPEQAVEKLDVRSRLKGRLRPNPLKASSSVQSLPIANQPESPEEESSNEKADANSAEVVSQLQPNEPNRSPLLRKRRPLNSRPSILAGQGQRKQQAEEESENYSNNVPAVDASPVTNNVEDHQSAVRPRVNIIRKGGPLARLPLQRNHNKPSQSPENTKEDDATLPSPVLQEATPKPTLPRIRQRQNRISSNNRGNSRLPIGGNGGSVDETSASVAAEDANIATSEAPVTVTSTYSRIRTNNNNKNSLLTRPIYRRPSYTSTPPPSVPAEQYSSPQASSTNVIGSTSRFGQRTRFTVPSKSESQATEQPTLSINSDNDNESEKQGQSSGQLNEQSKNSAPAQKTTFSEDTNSGGRKKVGFVRRKMVRGRPKQGSAEEQQQTEQQMLGENQETKPEEAAAAVVYDQAGSNPGAPETIHVSIHEEADGLNKQQEEQQQQTPSTQPGSEDSVDADDNGNSHNDHVKIVPVASAGEDGAAENTSHSGKEASGEDDKQGSVDEQDDDESDDTENSSDEANGKYYNNNNNAGDAGHHAGVSDLVDSDTYDLILNQDVRKILGTQNSTQHHTQYEEPSSAYQSPHSPSPPATHLANHGGVAGNSNVRKNNYQQQHHQQQEDYYGSYYDTYNTNTHDVNDHKYSAGVSGGSSSSLAPTHYNKESSAADGIETLELGTPDYDPNPGVDSSQYYWQGYENLEDEEESRVHMKYLRNKSTPLSSSSSPSSSSSQSIESGEEHSLSQNESSNNYNGDNINGVGISQSPVNPQQQTPFSNAVPAQQSQLSSSTNADADSDAKKDKNKRIRQKLRRPPSAYIGSSEDSSTNDHVRAPTSAPFTPSLQSPRPTYSGQEALLESVHQSVQTLPPKQENPNSQQLEQFIEQNNKNVAPSKNRSRVRVKLVTLKTTTPVPVVNNKYDDDNENYFGTTPDAAVSSSTGNSRPSRLPSSKFKFPPFRKSELPLVDATVAPVETESVSYNPQRVVLRPAASPSPPTTTTTTTTPAPRKPLRNYNYQNNDNGSNYNGINKGSVSSSLPGKGRFKVNPSSSESIKQTASPSSYTSPAPVIRKTQPRIKAPQFHQRLPVKTTTTTETPVVIRHQYQVASTSAPLAYSSSSENQPQQQQQPEPYHHTTSKLSEDDENIISIRITAQDDSSVIDNTIPPRSNENVEVGPHQYYQNVDTRHQPQQHQQQQQYLYQQENIIKEKPQHTPPPPPPPAPTPLISNDATKFNGKKNSGGKYSGRFKVPDKFELQKPHLLPSSNNNVDSADVRKPYVKPALPAPVSLPAKQQDRYQNQIEPESNGYNLYDNADVAHHRPQQTSSSQLGQLNNQVVLEEQRRPLQSPPQQAEEQEIVPDIRITIAAPDQHPNYNVANNEQNYNSNNNNVFINREPEPQFLVHAVREPQQQDQLVYQQQQQYYRPEHFEREKYNHNQALRNSQYGPFPSTDHWSGIPSSNSPKLPEHFEQNRQPAQRPHPSFEFQNEIRRPPVSHEFEQQRPSRPMMLPPSPPQQQAPGNNIRFVDSDEEDNHVQYSSVPVNPTVIQFGTEFGTDEVEEEVATKHPQRPALPFDHSGSHGLRENEGFSQQRPPISQQNRLAPLSPPQSYSHGIPPNENLEYQQRPVGNQEIQFSNNHISSIRSQNEQPQQQIINIHRQPPAPVQGQEPLIQGIPPNSVVAPPPVNHISIEIKDSELVNAQNGNDDLANNVPHPPPQQQHHMVQLPTVQQQQQQQIIQLPPPQQQQQQQIIQLPLVPPQQLHPQQQIHHQNININMPPPPPGMVIEQNFRPDQRLPIQNSQLPPEHNPTFIVQVDGRPIETTHAINQPHVQILKPIDHHPEKEPEIKIVNHPGPLMPQQLPNHPNFQTLNPEGRPVILPNIRDQQFLSNMNQPHPQPRPQQGPLQHQQPPTQGVPNFGEALMQQGFGEHHPSRPGQYGPPPPGQQRPSQYVPFNAPPKRNESQELSQQRLPVLPPPPQTFQNPFKFNGGQNQPFQPPQQQQHHASRPPPPYRQNFNGNYMSPIPQNQQFNNHHQQRPQQPPPVMMRMPTGIPNGQLGNNPHFPPQQNHHLRPRNSGMRTSRAANLTAEEEKDEREASGRLDISKQTVEEHEEQSQSTLDQQEAILKVPTPQNNILSDAISQVAPNPVSDKQAEGESSSATGNELPKIVPEAVGQPRQQRELVLNEQQKDDAAMLPKSTPLRASTVNSENFVQDEIPDEFSEPAVERHASQKNLYSTIPSSPLVEEKEQSEVEEDEYYGDNVDNLTRSKLGKQKKMQEQSGERQHKGKPEMEDGRLVQKSSSESKKSIMKIKSIGGKEKSEQLGKGTANKNGKEQQASDEKTGGDAEIQDFVAPKVIQRGFHPILPYSEQDPGPVVVQMLPMVEKFFPQPTMTTMGNGDRVENGPQGVMMMGSGSFHQDPNLLRNNKHASTGNLPAVVMMPTNVLNAQSSVVVNNQAPFRSLLHNHLA